MKGKMAEMEIEAKKLAEENVELKKLAIELKAEKQSIEIDKTLEKLVNDKKIVPAQKDFLKTLLSELPETKEKKYKFGDKDYEGLESVVMAFIDAHAPVPPTELDTEKGDINTDLTDKAKKYAEDHKVSFAEALVTITRRGE